MPTDGLTITCIKGEEWPISSLKSYVKEIDDPLTEESVTFLCPLGHSFNLKKALSKGIFSQEQAEKIIIEAKKIKIDIGRLDKREYLASDHIPDKEVSELNIPKFTFRDQWKNEYRARYPYLRRH